MKYMTPELYNNYQDEEDDGDAWDNNLEEYEKRLQVIYLPDNVRDFLKIVGGSLHDADMDTWVNLTPRVGKFQLAIEQKDAGEWKFLCLLRYNMTQPLETVYHKGDGFSDYPPIWLYDEFDQTGVDTFTHNILCSNGLEVKITFDDFHFLFVPTLTETPKGWEYGYTVR